MKFKAPSHVAETDTLDLAQQADVAKIRVTVVVHIEFRDVEFPQVPRRLTYPLASILGERALGRGRPSSQHKLEK